MVDLPFDDLTDPLRLADWLELHALCSPDHNSSRGDLESALRTAALLELDDDEEIELKLLEVFWELEERARAAEQAYPFDLAFRGGVLELRSNWESFPAYVFCLCLSYFGSEDAAPRKLFEEVSRLAARGYLQGEAVGFGSPRTELPRSFSVAIAELCQRIGEGEGYSDQPSLSRKDDRLDLVAWKEFVDRHPSKVLMFGQCASGWNWEAKLTELQPKAFCDHWMQETPVSPLISSLFIPHRIEPSKWKWVARNAGIVFDRCRIAFWAHQEGANFDAIISWIKGLLVQVQS
ncbi:MAG: hypothetical protein H8D78_08900 [Chloroflexi bacterium]|nr:hypothetical protein [Chloroflexota bacterium]